MLNDWVVVDCSVAPRMDDDYIARAVSSGVDAFNWTVCGPEVDRERAEQEILAARDFLRRREATVQLALSVEDVRVGASEGRPSFIFGPQNALPVAEDFSNLDRLFALGVRIIQLTYNRRNAFGCGCLEEDDTGLTELGKVLIREMSDRGIVLDLSHAGSRTALEAIEATVDPPIISHGNSRHVEATPRNFPDEVMKAIADKNGVIGLTLWSPMVGSVKNGQPGVSDWIRHLDHVMALVGPDHVGFGSDHSEDTPRDEWETLFSRNGVHGQVARRMGAWYGYDTRFIEGVDRATGLAKFFDQLGERGYSDSILRGLIGENFLRVFDTVWRTSLVAPSST